MAVLIQQCCKKSALLKIAKRKMRKCGEKRTKKRELETFSLNPLVTLWFELEEQFTIFVVDFFSPKISKQIGPIRVLVKTAVFLARAKN